MYHEKQINLALAQHKAGNLAAARKFYEGVLAVDAQHPDALHLLGLLSYQTGELKSAIDLMEKALALRPEVGHFHANLAAAYRANQDWPRAVELFRSAVRLSPKTAARWINLGNTLRDMEQLDEGLSCLAEAVRLAPDMAPAHVCLGFAQKDIGLLDEALASFRHAIILEPASTMAWSGWLYTLNFHPAYSPGQIFAEHRRWGALLADPLTAAAPPLTKDRPVQRRLRVGYVAPTFRDHAVNFFVEPLLAGHDRESFEVFCYSDVGAPDDVTERLRKSVDRWRTVVGVSDDALTRQIRADGVDILVDLSGHMGAHRLLMFARKPAPVQVTYIGYQATTGMKGMDYRLTDDFADPPGQTDCWHTEKLVRLPRAFFCYRPPSESPPVQPPPCRTRGYVTFGSFNQVGKITPEVLTTWAEILAAVPESRLQLLFPASASLSSRVRRLMEKYGIATGRIVFVERGTRAAYLAHYHTVDIALDPFPFNGHTTTCDALWMGVPVVTLCGRSYAQRFGSVPLMAIGLGDCIATSRKDYIATAVRWANSAEALDRIRNDLRGRVKRSVLRDEAGFTRHVETVYRELWQKRSR
jgi:predicted O-linked N-acetylglucosamine transferase (SPINDLY family)